MSEAIPRIHGNGSVAEDWLRLARKRMQDALDAIDRVSKRSTAEYGEQEETRMVRALRAKLTEVENRLARKDARAASGEIRRGWPAGSAHAGFAAEQKHLEGACFKDAVTHDGSGRVPMRPATAVLQSTTLGN